MSGNLEPDARQPPAPAPGSASALALLYCPVGLRAEFALLLALEAEIGAGLARRLDHALAHARLAWWGEEAARFTQGTARHPWLRAEAAGAANSAGLDLSVLVQAALVDLAEGQRGTPAGRRLRGAIFCAAAAGLDPQPPTPSGQDTLRALGALSAEFEPAAAAVLTDALVRLKLAVADIGAAQQRAWAPLLVWCALGARQARRAEAGSTLAGFADNVAAWRAARAAAAGRLRIGGTAANTTAEGAASPMHSTMPDGTGPAAAAHLHFAPAPDALAGRVIALTGAGDGIGRAVALAAAAHGAQLILIGRTVRKLEALHAQIAALEKAEASIAPLDLERAVARDYDLLAAAITERFGRLDGLVHIAGILGALAPLEHFEVPTWCRVLHVNLTAAFALTQVLLPALRAAADGSIVFTSSGVARHPKAYWGAYAVSKAGIETLAAMLAQEVEDSSPLRVNVLNPGPVRTRMRAQAYPAEDPRALAGPADIVGPYLWLLSAASRGVTGQSLDCQAARPAPPG